MNHTLRRVLCLLLAVLLCCGLFSSAGAARSVVLTAVNDSFLPLSNSTMPTRQNGEYYVPYSVFGRLGLRSAVRDNTLSLSSSAITLTFNTAAGTVYDQNMNSYSSPAYLINGTIYVPARLVCGRFGYSYSTLHSGDTLILRICSSAATLSDSEFLSASGSTIRSMLNTYNGIPNVSNPPGTQDPTTEIVQKPSSIGFAVTGPASGDTADILTALDAAGQIAAFFLPIDLDGYHAGLLREIAAAGHTFGFIVEADAPITVDDLARANQSLFHATGMTSRLLFLAPNAAALSADARDALTSAGYRLWDATHTVSPETRASRTISNLLNEFSKTTSAVILQLPQNKVSAQVIREISDYMRTHAVALLRISTLSTPNNDANDRR